MFDRAGFTVEQFCRREGLCRSSFARWRSRLLGGVSGGRLLHKELQSQASTAFVDLGPMGTGAPAIMRCSAAANGADLKDRDGPRAPVHNGRLGTFKMKYYSDMSRRRLYI